MYVRRKPIDNPELLSVVLFYAEVKRKEKNSIDNGGINTLLVWRNNRSLSIDLLLSTVLQVQVDCSSVDSSTS